MLKDDPNFEYRAISELSEATDAFQAEESQSQIQEIDDYEMLLHATEKKLQILVDDDVSVTSSATKADEFLRNFFIKFGMKKTLESFQTEWFELRANNQLREDLMPEIPPIYQKQQELCDELAVLQNELDEARIIAEKARSTYDKLRK